MVVQLLPERLRKAPLAPFFFLAVACVSVLALILGQDEFAGYDCSMLIDAGWRMSLHQRPFIDFPNVLPPGFLLTSGWAVTVFGPHWYAFTLAQCFLFCGFNACAYCMVHRLAANESRRFRIAMLAGFLLATTIPQVGTVHLWHSLQGSLCVTLLMLWFALNARLLDGSSGLAGAPQGTDRLDCPALAVAVIASAALWLSKPNLALAGHASLLCYGLFRTRMLRLWGLVTGLGLASALLVLRTMRLTPMEVIASYRQVTGRPTIRQLLAMYAGHGLSGRIQLDGDASYAVVAGAGVLLVAFLGSLRRHPELRAGIPTLSSGLLISAAGMATDWDMRSDDMAPVYFGVWFAVFCLVPKSPFLLRVQQLSVAGLVLYFVPFGYCAAFRARMIAAGTWAGIGYGRTEIRHDPFFGEFRGREEFWRELGEIDRYHAQTTAGESFFGPRLEFEYARYGIASPLRLPIWWHPGSSYGMAVEPEIARACKQHRFTTVYTVEQDLRIPVPLPASIRQDLSNYDLISPPGEILHVYRRKAGR